MGRQQLGSVVQPVVLHRLLDVFLDILFVLGAVDIVVLVLQLQHNICQQQHILLGKQHFLFSPDNFCISPPQSHNLLASDILLNVQHDLHEVAPH